MISRHRKTDIIKSNSYTHLIPIYKATHEDETIFSSKKIYFFLCISFLCVRVDFRFNFQHTFRDQFQYTNGN